MRKQILDAAVQLFSQYGYHAAPLRDIARITGIQAASIYYHYPNKQALLVEIMETHMLRLNHGLERILREHDDPSQRLYEAIAHHIRLHTTYKSEFFIVDTELRSLEGESQSYILSLRDTYENLLQGLLQDGIERGFFRPTDVKIVSYAIIAMCTEVAAWFRPNGRLSVHQVIQIYHQFITDGLVLAPRSAQISVGYDQ
jgi:AcrR family transcriptional regulator